MTYHLANLEGTMYALTLIERYLLGVQSHLIFTTETPTGFESLYVVDKSVEPVGLTRPRPGAVSKGASTTEFGVKDKGYFLHNGNIYFAIDGYDENTAKEFTGMVVTTRSTRLSTLG